LVVLSVPLSVLRAASVNVWDAATSITPADDDVVTFNAFLVKVPVAARVAEVAPVPSVMAPPASPRLAAAPAETVPPEIIVPPD
jgi:hypothetical protein